MGVRLHMAKVSRDWGGFLGEFSKEVRNAGIQGPCRAGDD